jgi:hypothetical protein
LPYNNIKLTILYYKIMIVFLEINILIVHFSSLFNDQRADRQNANTMSTVLLNDRVIHYYIMASLNHFSLLSNSTLIHFVIIWTH